MAPTASLDSRWPATVVRGVMGCGVLAAAFLLAACSANIPPSSVPAVLSVPDKVMLRFGSLPILDAIPAYIALKEGYFAAQNLQVEITPFDSAVERDTALLAGRIDAGLSDLPAEMLLNKEGPRAKIVRIAVRSTPQRAQYAILASPRSYITSAADIRGKEIAVSTNTVIEYVTDRLLSDAGLKPGEIKKTNVVAIPLRRQMLVEGPVSAATLPEPQATLARNEGAKHVAGDQGTPYGHSVVLFLQKTMTERPAAVGRFLDAWEKGVGAFNTAPDAYGDLMNEAARVPGPLGTTLTLPVFPTAGVPAEAEVEAVARWFMDKGVLKQMLTYAQVVDASYLPRT